MAEKEVWNQAKAAYQRGEGTLRVLAQRFKVSEKAIQQRCMRGKWRKERVRIGEKVEEIVIASLAEETKERLRRMVGGFDKDVERIEKCFEQMDDTVDPDMLHTLMRSRKVAVDGFQALGAIPIFQESTTHGALSSEDVLNLLLKVSSLSGPQREKLKALPDPRTIEIEVTE